MDSSCVDIIHMGSNLIVEPIKKKSCPMKRIAETKKNVKKLFEAMQGEEWMNQE